HSPFGHEADLYIGDAGFALFFLFFAQDISGREDKAFLIRIRGDDTDFDLPSDPFVKVLDISKSELGSRDESADSFHVCNDSALYSLADLYADIGLFFFKLYETLPAEDFCRCL